MKDTAKWVVLYCVLGIMVCGIVCCIWFSFTLSAKTANAFDYTKKSITDVNTAVSNTKSMLEAMQAEEEKVTKEDDVIISSSYEIKSTLAISDAYKSGNRDELNDKQKETLDMASAILKEIIKDGMSDYEKELAVYEWMIQNLKSDDGILTVIPTTTEDCDNPFGVLKYHNAVCVGYATTFRMFMQMMDIECMVVHNLEEYHSWNLIKLDGHWYHTDVYSDMDAKNYSNFNMSDTQCANGHEWDKTFFPVADSVEYNYAYMHSEKIDDAMKLPELLKTAIESGKNVYYQFGGEKLQEQSAIAETIMNGISSRISYSDVYSQLLMSWSWCAVDKTTYLLSVSIQNMNDEPANALSDEQQAEIESKLNSLFGGEQFYLGD